MTPGRRGEREPATQPAHTSEAEPDAHIGAVEGDRPEQHRNANGPALDKQGLPADTVKICEDVLGAHTDESQG